MRQHGSISVRSRRSPASLILLASVVMGAASGVAGSRKPMHGAATMWRAYRSGEGGFLVSMPGQPRHTKQAVESPTGKDVVHFHTAEVGESAAFSVVTFDGPAGFLQTPSAVILKGSRDEILARANGKLVSERSLSLQGQPGRELVLAQPDGSTNWLRMYLVGQRLYQVAAVTPKKLDAQRFLGSFRLILR